MRLVHQLAVYKILNGFGHKGLFTKLWQTAQLGASSYTPVAVGLKTPESKD